MIVRVECWVLDTTVVIFDEEVCCGVVFSLWLVCLYLVLCGPSC